MQENKYGAILCDPPWAFKTYSRPDAIPCRAAQHYKTATRDDLASIPVQSWAAKDCALFMWVVDAHMLEALALGQGWGFTYKTIVFIWDKQRIGMGYWSRKEAEVCLLFTKGHPPRIGKGVKQIIRAKRREHSRKPDEIYERIQALVGGPYLEMFARQKWSGWDVWGDETEKFNALEG